jgi:hypothetical protein
VTDVAKGTAMGAADGMQTEPSTAFSRKGTEWCEVTKLNDTTFRVRLGGLLRASWMAALCNRLADARISIEHTHARLAHDNSWIAELHVFPLDGAPSPLAIPYIDLVETEESTSLTPLRLDSYRLIDSRDYGGSLMLTLEGPDTLGLLGSLLAPLAGLGLFPVEVHIETRNGRAYDCLWLGAGPGVAPSANAKASLDQLLSRSLDATDSRT